MASCYKMINLALEDEAGADRHIHRAKFTTCFTNESFNLICLYVNNTGYSFFFITLHGRIELKRGNGEMKK